MERQLRVRISETGHGLHLRAGEPYIYEEPEMRILDEPSTFLRRHFVESGKRKSAETWRAAAYQLKFWLEFLVAQDIPWDIASVDDLKGYRDALHVAISPHSKGDYDSKTIRNYMLTVISFYRFAAEQGWYVGTLSQTEQATRQFTSIDRDALAHTRKGAPLVRVYSQIHQLNRQALNDFRDDLPGILAGTTPIASLDYDLDDDDNDEDLQAAISAEAAPMGLCLYLALMKHTLGDKFTFAVLDDVLMSVDTGHRREVCRLLKTKFPNTQFVLTTHDRVWLQYMKTEGLIKSGQFFGGWHIDTGPRIWDDKDIWGEIEEALTKDYPYLTPRKGASEQLRCNCGAINVNLKLK